MTQSVYSSKTRVCRLRGGHWHYDGAWWVAHGIFGASTLRTATRGVRFARRAR